MSSEGWETLTLDEVAHYQNGRATKPAESRDSGMLVVKIRELNSGVSEKSVRVDPSAVQAKHKISDGDLLFAWSASVGIYIWRGEEAALNQHIFKVQAKPGTDQLFLRYLLEYELRALFAAAAERQTTMGHVRKADLARLTCRRPPIEEQRAIAEVLGALDDRIELLTSSARTMDELRQALFNEWVLDSPERSSWSHVPLREVCNTQYGFTASATDDPVGPHFVRVTDINKHPWVDWAKTPFAEVPVEQLHKFRLHPGDILVARMADPGKSALIDSSVEAVFASYLVRLTTEPADLAQFVYGYLQSPEYVEYAEGAQYGSVQKNMNARVIVGCNIPMPPKEVIDRYSASAAALRTRMAAALEEAQTIGDLRDALLPRLLSGELRLEDPARVLGAVG